MRKISVSKINELACRGKRKRVSMETFCFLTKTHSGVTKEEVTSTSP